MVELGKRGGGWATQRASLMPLSHGPTFLADIGPNIGPYLSPTAGNLSHAPTFCMLGQLPVRVVTVYYGVIYGARSNDERERRRTYYPEI